MVPGCVLSWIIPTEIKPEVSNHAMDRRTFLRSAALGAACAAAPPLSVLAETAPSAGSQSVRIHPAAEAGKLPHIWEECVGSDRAIVGTRKLWLDDLVLVNKTVGVRSVRFHGLFNDEMGVWPGGAKQPNFLYIDTVFDANGVNYTGGIIYNAMLANNYNVNNSSFSISMVDVNPAFSINPADGFLADFDANATGLLNANPAPPAPEPGSLTLLALGIGLVAGARRLRRR